MARPSTLYRFKIDFSDIDRGLYESIDFRLAMHPSESLLFLMTRAIAFLLNFESALEFSAQGLGDPDQAPLFIKDPRGGLLLWIEIGNPSAKRLHSASKAAQKVKVYTYKDPKLWFEEMKSSDIFQFDKIEVFSFQNDFLKILSENLQRNNNWGILFQDSTFSIQINDESIQGEITRHR